MVSHGEKGQNRWLANIINAFLGTEMIIGGIFAILFDRVLPNRDEYAE